MCTAVYKGREEKMRRTIWLVVMIAITAMLAMSFTVSSASAGKIKTPISEH